MTQIRFSFDPGPRGPPPDVFVAIDFETADDQPDSACAVGIVRVEGGEIAHRAYRLIRPPRRQVPHAWVHGLSWRKLKAEPTFRDIWPELAHTFDGAERIVAHNAAFDRAVLEECCRRAGLRAPGAPWECTVELARRVWRLPSAKLPVVSAHLGVALDHHHALSDAEACARIFLAGRALEQELGG